MSFGVILSIIIFNAMSGQNERDTVLTANNWTQIDIRNLLIIRNFGVRICSVNLLKKSHNLLLTLFLMF